MKRNRGLRYFCLMSVVFFAILAINLIIMIIIAETAETGRMPGRLNYAKQIVLADSSGRMTVNEDIKASLKEHGEFAMLISDEGKVIWSVYKPDEIPETYSIKDVAAFSRWYLKDYPVYTAVMDDGIFVLGEPKDSLWRYNIVFEMKELKNLFNIFPYVIILDVLFVIIIPFFIMKRQENVREKERVEWISGVSHDVRTPLSLILGNAQDIMDNSADMKGMIAADSGHFGNSSVNVDSGVDRVHKNAASIKKQALRIRELVNNLNTENILNFGISKPKDEIVLSKLIRDTVCSIMEQDEKNIYDMEFEVSPVLEGKVVKADEGLVRRMLTNIIINSMTHNPGGCGIKITFFSGNCFGSPCILTVRDNGIGAAPDIINMLNGKGSGIGLSEHGLGLTVVKKIAALYHWKVSFASDNGFICSVRMKIH